MSTILDEDIIMKDYTNNNYNSSNKFYLPSSNYIRPRKRTFLEMLQDSNQIIINRRIDNYKLVKKSEEINYLRHNYNKKDDLVLLNFNKNNEVKKNLLVKKKVEYDEEKERKLVENYYKIKNAELNKLRFGTD